MNNKKLVKISIIDEDPIFLNALYHTLDSLDSEKYPIELKAFSDGLLFINDEWSLSDQPQIIILNDFLPKKSGLELIQLLRKRPENKNDNIIMMTQGISEDDIIFAYKSGIDFHLRKPFSLRVFKARMESMIERVGKHE